MIWFGPYRDRNAKDDNERTIDLGTRFIAFLKYSLAILFGVSFVLLLGALVVVILGIASALLPSSVGIPGLEFPTLHCDAPRPWGIYFQDSATPQMEGLVELHDNILFYLVIILFGVGWLLVSIVKTYSNTESPLAHKYLSHGTLIELI